MAESSFWEKLGRGVGYGWQKTKALSSQLDDQVEGRATLTKAKNALASSYLHLGKLVARESIDRAKDTFTSTVPGVPELLETIGEQRALVDRLEKESEAKERELAEKQAQKDSSQPPGGKGKAEGTGTS